MKRLMCTLLALTLLLTFCVGCGKQEDLDPPSGIFYDLTGIDPRETVVTVDGNEVCAELYCYWSVYNCSTMEYQLAMFRDYYGSFTEMFDAQGNILWDATFLGAMPLKDYVGEQTKQSVTTYAVIENLARKYGVVLTEEDRSQIAQDRASMVTELGGEEAFQDNLYQMGITEASFTRLMETGFLAEGLQELILQEGSELYLTAEGWDNLATYADHILLSTVDETTGAPLSEEKIAEKKALAEDILSQLNAGSDIPSLFAQLADTYSEDPGRAGSPDGYIFTPGTMVEPFEQAAATLSPGQISGIVETEYGYHILLRKDLQQGLADHPEQKQELLETHLQSLLSEASAAATVEISEKLNDWDVSKLYLDYTDALLAIQSQAEGEANAEADSSADSGESGESTSGE